jgi:hypothetical protein
MPGYLSTMLLELKHPAPKRPQFAPYPATPRHYGKQFLTLPDDDEEPPDITPLSPDDAKRIPKIVGKLLYYARAVDGTLNVALSSPSSKQTKPTADTRRKVHQLLDYCHTNPDAGITYKASDMFLVHLHDSDASYSSELRRPLLLNQPRPQTRNQQRRHPQPHPHHQTRRIIRRRRRNWRNILYQLQRNYSHPHHPPRNGIPSHTTHTHHP